jgi:hypothetical protein
MVTNEWLVEAVKELLDDHGKVDPDEIQMSPERSAEIRAVIYGDDDMRAAVSMPPPADAPGQTSVGDLIRQLNNVAARMRTGSNHRRVVVNAAFALHQLVQRLDKFENPPTGKM